LMVSFVHAQAILLTGIIALFFSDSLATIVGVSYGRHKLPYNKSKSAEGALAFWASASIIAFPLIGAYSFLIGSILAIVESVSGPRTVDDNISIAIAVIAIYAVILLA
ncbi:cytidylyltransferase family protein, partial [mine drainage metagenome]